MYKISQMCNYGIDQSNKMPVANVNNINGTTGTYYQYTVPSFKGSQRFVQAAENRKFLASAVLAILAFFGIGKSSETTQKSDNEKNYNTYEELKANIEERAQKAKEAAKVEYQKAYDELCMETMGKKCNDLVKEAQKKYMWNDDETSVIETARSKYIYNKDETSVIETARSKYMFNKNETSVIETARKRYYAGEITEKEYNSIKEKAEAEYYRIKDKAEAKYYSIKDEAEAKYFEIKERVDALNKKRNLAIKKVDAKRDAALKECAKMAKENPESTMTKTETEKVLKPQKKDNEEKKVLRRQIRDNKKAEALKKAQQEKVNAKKAAIVAQTTESLEKLGYTNIQELSNGSLLFVYQGTKYALESKPGHSANVYKGLLKAAQDGILAKDFSLKAVLSKTQLYDCDWLFGDKKESSEKLNDFIAAKEQQEKEKLIAKQKQEKMMEIERKIDDIIPPASSIKVIDYKEECLQKPCYIEGYWDYETAPNGSNIESSKHWVSGSSYPGLYLGKVTYEYNGVTQTICENGNKISVEDLLYPVKKEINAKRAELRRQLTGD